MAALTICNRSNCPAMTNSKAFSYCILAGTGMYCIAQYRSSAWKLPCGTFAVIILHSFFGIWHYKGNIFEMSRVAREYGFTRFIQDLSALAFISVHAWLRYGYTTIAYVQAIISAIPFAAYVFKLNESQLASLDSITSLNGLTLCFLSLVQHDYYAAIAALSYMGSYFYLRTGRFSILDLSPLAASNYGLCVFCYFTLRSITGHGAPVIE